MLSTIESIQIEGIEIGEILISAAVGAMDVVRDFREGITNAIGGRMTLYENLIETTTARALEQLQIKARNKGYDGVLGLKITNQTMVAGAAQIVVYGNGFKYRSK